MTTNLDQDGLATFADYPDAQYTPSTAAHGQRFVQIYCHGCSRHQAGACEILAESYQPAGTRAWRIRQADANTYCLGYVPDMGPKRGDGTLKLI